jgi:hypothetical protein
MSTRFSLQTLAMNLHLQCELQEVIDDLLTKTAICAPSIIVSKPKFHFLTHLPFFIRRFGPALLFSTERYESFNTVARLNFIHSNRLAPSRDSAMTFAQLDRVKHIASGGWWFDTDSQRYRNASQNILKTILTSPEYARLLGLSVASKLVPGMFLPLLSSHVLIIS